MNGEQLTALLSRTYIKEGLSDADRYHAKCGDVGIKSLQRIFPSLKLPKKFRCVFCIDGKIHKFGHGPCQEGRRTNYEPGVCLHTDYSGMLDPTGVHDTPKYFWAEDQNIYGLFV